MQAIEPQNLATPDLIQLLLEDKRSPQTRRAYESDLADFLAFACCSVNEFIAQSTPQIAFNLTRYKNHLRERGLSEATINRRLAAVKSLLKFARRLGLCETDGRGLVDGERARSYRDTRGVDLKTMRRLMRAPAQRFGSTLRGLRDTAILALLCENALRRAEVCALDVADFDTDARTLAILGKGRGTQKEKVTLSAACAGHIAAYIATISDVRGVIDAPLFISVDRRPEYFGARLTPDGLHHLIGDYGRHIGLKRLTPHQLRHSAITAALDATKGDVRKVQRLSRHAKVEVLMTYDDNRLDFQGEVSGLLSGLLAK